MRCYASLLFVLGCHGGSASSSQAVPPPPTIAPTQNAETSDQAYAIALAYLQTQLPNTPLALLEETQGGGLDGPWVFMIGPASKNPGDQIPGLGPLLVQHGTRDVVQLRPNPHGIRAAVAEWETQTYGHPQR